MRRPWIHAIAVSTLLVAPGLRAVTPAGFAVVAQTPRLTYYAREGQKLDVRRLDQRLAHFEAQLGQVARPARYFHHERPEDVAATTGRYAGGVTYSTGDVHATPFASDHELVHLVGQDLGRPGAFFDEGLAVVLGDRARFRGEPVDRVAARVTPRLAFSQVVAAFDEREPGTGYAVAGSFVQHLVRAYGLPRLVQFYRATRRSTTDAAFLLVYGRTLDEEGTLWLRSL